VGSEAVGGKKHAVPLKGRKGTCPFCIYGETVEPLLLRGQEKDKKGRPVQWVEEKGTAGTRLGKREKGQNETLAEKGERAHSFSTREERLPSSKKEKDMTPFR